MSGTSFTRYWGRDWGRNLWLKERGLNLHWGKNSVNFPCVWMWSVLSTSVYSCCLLHSWCAYCELCWQLHWAAFFRWLHVCHSCFPDMSVSAVFREVFIDVMLEDKSKGTTAMRYLLYIYMPIDDAALARNLFLWQDGSSVHEAMCSGFLHMRYRGTWYSSLNLASCDWNWWNSGDHCFVWCSKDASHPVKQFGFNI